MDILLPDWNEVFAQERTADGFGVRQDAAWMAKVSFSGAETRE
jgi:hypothetical protein